MGQKPTYIRVPPYLDANLCNVGELLTVRTCGGARDLFQWGRIWQRNNIIAAYSGPPIPSDNGNLASEFFVIHNNPLWENNSGTSGRRYLTGRAHYYDADTTPPGAVTRTADWYINHDDVAAEQEVWPDESYTGTAENNATDYPPYNRNLPILPISSAGGFQCAKMVTANYLFASITFWMVPDQFFNEADWSNIEHSLPRRKFRQKSILRGYDVNSDNPGTLARVMHYTDRVAAGPTDNDSLVYNTSRCMFQTPFPRGVYIEDDTTYRYHRRFVWNATDYTFHYYIKPRNLTGTTSNVNMLPAFVATYSGNTGHGVKFTSARTANTWEWTSTAAGVEQLITYADGTPATGLSCKPDWDSIRIEIKSGAATSALALKTVSLWEPNIAS